MTKPVDAKLPVIILAKGTLCDEYGYGIWYV